MVSKYPLSGRLENNANFQQLLRTIKKIINVLYSFLRYVSKGRNLPQNIAGWSSWQLVRFIPLRSAVRVRLPQHSLTIKKEEWQKK